MLRISWDFARQLWQGKRIIIQMDGANFAAWSGVISMSYYEPIGLPIPQIDLHDLRIIYDDARFTYRFPNWRVPLSKWRQLRRGPRLIAPSRVTDLRVTENDESEIPGGDIWCSFVIPEKYRLPNISKWHSGYFIVQMEEKRGQMLAAARQQKAMHFRRF